MYNQGMFNTQHILYMVISGILSAGLLYLANARAKDDESKNRILKFSAIITVVIHYSNLWVDYFTTGGTATLENNQLLPVYPCNVVMWMLLITSLMRNKKRLLFQILSEFCFYGGTICGVLGIVLNTNFDNNPTLADYDILKGLLSHSTMLFGCLYMFVGGFVKIRVFNAVSVAAGLLTFVICGMGVNALYEYFGMEAPDGMWLRSNPYLPIPSLVLGLLFVVILFFVLHLWDMRQPEAERWYKKMQRRKHHERIVL